MDDVTFRPATASDVPLIQPLVHHAYRGDRARVGWTHEADLLDAARIDEQALSESIGDPGQVIVLAERDGLLIGCVHVTDKGEGLAYLGMLTVDATFQGGGLGRRLIEQAEAIARSRLAADRMEMTVIVQRTELIDWYERRGYALTGETRPFPTTDPRFGVPLRSDLAFVVLERALT
ncbi:GNAT family N-acetyltransferase [Brevundimonas sp. TWP2-3-4b2]|uniref:GNAT family N-acetyltransferase n=1 Tax=Brevundimonas sp. TWP2-3-4b2 TaxID=2804595 RepID=UPI003CE75C0F